MKDLQRLLDNNRLWAETNAHQDPQFFASRARGQTPRFLAIGCSDSRVPLEMLTGAEPGEMFVHRNIANQVYPSDLNALSVLQYAVEGLRVPHVLVLGHYGCAGIAAAMGESSMGLVDNWLGDIRDVRRRHSAELDALATEEARGERLVELNVLHQVLNLARTPVIQSAWRTGQRPMIHGAVFGIHDGILRTLVTEVCTNAQADALIPLA
jgi:carbonic anhydrase